MSYWVIGGTYKDTKFQEIEVGHKLQKYGPLILMKMQKQMG